jgi:hypothetical protein
MTIQEWLNAPCPESELKPNSDGSVFIPIQTLKGPTKLGNKEYIEDWDLIDYVSDTFQLGKQVFLRASGRLKIEFVGEPTSIKIGGACIPIKGGNTNYEATAQSEVIKNAAKKFGNQFGFHLNQDLTSEDLNLSDMPPEHYDDIDSQIKKQRNAS